MEQFATYPSLRGRGIFVTGGATGIGAAIVQGFLRQGSVVGFIDIDTNAAHALIENCRNIGLSMPWFRKGDVTKIEELQSSISDFSEYTGTLDVLVNNVANDSRHDPQSVSEESWRSCMSVNLDSAFFASQEAIALMLPSKSGSIINMSSISALRGPAHMPGYVSAKAALLGMSKALAREYGRDGIRVNAVLPGWVITERQLNLWLSKEAEEESMSRAALKKRIMPSDVADLVLFLASDQSRMITGQDFIIDGGRL